MQPSRPLYAPPSHARPVTTTEPPTPPPQAVQHAAQPEGIGEFFRERLFVITSLNFPLQLTVGGVIGFSLGAAFLILFHNVLQPAIVIQFGPLTFGSTPLATVIVISLFWIIGWSLMLTGALHGNWLMRVVVFLIFIFIFVQDFVPSLVTLAFGWPLVLLAFYAITIITLTARARNGRIILPRFLPGISFVVVCTLLLLHYALLAVFLGGDMPDITTSISNNISGLIFLILPVYFLAGSDFVEWVQVSSGELSHWLQLRGRTPWLLFVATALVAGAVLLYRLSELGDFQPPLIFAVLDVAEMALFGAIVCAVLLLLARWGRLERLHRTSVPFIAIVAGALSALGLVAIDVMLATVTNQLNAGKPLADAFTKFVFLGNGTIFLALVPLLVAILVGLPLLLLGRGKQLILASSGFFLLVFGLRSALLYLPNMLQLFGLPTRHLPVHIGAFNAHTSVPNLSLPTVQIIVALFTVLYLLWLLVRRAPRSYLQDVLGHLFILNAGLQILEWLSQLLTASVAISPVELAPIAALLLVLAFLWDLLTSGEQTNESSLRAPRYARVCMYVGYSLLSITITLYLSIAPASASNTDPESWTPSGVTDLGVAILLAGFIIGFYRASVRAAQVLNQGDERVAGSAGYDIPAQN